MVGDGGGGADRARPRHPLGIAAIPPLAGARPCLRLLRAFREALLGSFRGSVAAGGGGGRRFALGTLAGPARRRWSLGGGLPGALWRGLLSLLFLRRGLLVFRELLAVTCARPGSPVTVRLGAGSGGRARLLRNVLQ